MRHGAKTGEITVQKIFKTTLKHTFAAILLALWFTGCGDEQIVSLPGSGRLQGVWEGTISLVSTGGELAQTSRMRLELIQRDNNSFEGLLLKIDPLAEGFGRAVEDTFLVTKGTILDDFVRFDTVDPKGGTADFQGELIGKKLSGTAHGTDYTGEWNAEFIF